jgi:integrase
MPLEHQTQCTVNTSSNDLAIIQDLISRAEAYAFNARAKATIRAYHQDWQQFSRWCESRRITPLPTTTGMLALYITDQACHLSIATIQRRLAGIVAVHRQLGLPLDIRNSQLADVMDGIRRSHGRPAASKRALTPTELRQAVESLPMTPKGIRSRALLLLGFSGGLRRSELCGLDAAPGGTGTGWIKFAAEGIVLALRYSKENQDGIHVTEVAVPFGQYKTTCPVDAVQKWLELAGINEGALFRSILKSGHITQHRLGDDAVAQCVKAVAARIGIDPVDVAAHSLRAGFVTAAALAGRSEYDIMRHTRHKNGEMVRRYIRPTDLFRSSPAGSVSL